MNFAWIAVVLAVACHDPPGAPRQIHLVQEGLGIWHHTTGGLVYRIDVDLALGTFVTVDPGGVRRVRVIGDAEAAELARLARDARAEPATAQSQATDYLEQLDISDGRSSFHVENNGPISRPAAAELVRTLATAAHWPAG